MTSFVVTSAQWIGAASFIGGLLTKTAVDVAVARHTFAREKRLAFLEEQLKSFYWPLCLLLEKDDLMFQCMTLQDGDPTSQASRLGSYVEANMLLPSQQEAEKLIESALYLAQKPRIVDLCIRYAKHVELSGILQTASVHGIPMSFGAAYPKDILAAIREEANALQQEYDELIRKGAARLRA